MSYSIFLLRHGPLDAPPGLYGKTDIPVAEEVNKLIVDTLSVKLSKLHRVVTSPLKRCRQLAGQIQTRWPTVSLSTSPLLSEMDFGDYDGWSFDDLQPHWESVKRLWSHPFDHNLPNAETLLEFHERIHQAWNQLLNECNQNTVVVCHGGTIRMLLCVILKLDWRSTSLYTQLKIEHASLTEITVYGTNPKHCQVCSIGERLLPKQ